MHTIVQAELKADRLFSALNGQDDTLEDDEDNEFEVVRFQGYQPCPDRDLARVLLAHAHGYKGWSDLKKRIGTSTAPEIPDFLTRVHIMKGVAERLGYDRNATEIAVAAIPVEYTGDLAHDVNTIMSLIPLAMPGCERLWLAKTVMTTIWVAAAKGTDPIKTVQQIMLRRGTESDRTGLYKIRTSMLDPQVRGAMLQGEMMREQSDPENDGMGVYMMFDMLRDAIAALDTDALAALMLLPIAEMAAWGGPVDQRSLLITLILESRDHLGDGPIILDLAA